MIWAKFKQNFSIILLQSSAHIFFNITRNFQYDTVRILNHFLCRICMISANFPNVQDSLCGIPRNMQGFNQFFSRTWLVYVSKNKCKSSSTRVYLAICTKYVHVQRKSKNRVYVRVYLHLTHDTWPTLLQAAKVTALGANIFDWKIVLKIWSGHTLNSSPCIDH